MITTPRLSLVSLSVVLAASLAAPACSSGDTGSTGTTGTGGSTSASTSATSSSGGGTSSVTSSTDASSSASGDPCPPPGYGGGEKPVDVKSVAATVVDPNGKALDQVPIQLCGVNLCLYGKTSATGAVDVTNSGSTMLKGPVFKFGDGFAFARLGVPITMAGATDLMTVVTAPLPAAGVAFAAGKAVSSGDVTLEIAAGGGVDIDTLTYDTPDKQQLRAVTLPVDKEMGIVQPGFLQLYGVGPLETVFCPAAKVTVTNQDPVKLPAGTDVEFWILGLDNVSQDWAPYGAWQMVSAGKVSADGKTISTTAPGLPKLTTFAVAKKP